MDEGDSILLEENYYQLLNVSKTVNINHVHFYNSLRDFCIINII